MKNNLLSRLTDEGKKFFNGGMIFFFSATIVNLGNYLFNLVLGRWLGPASFSDLSIIITLFLIVIFFAATLQTITARFSAIYTSNNDLEKIARLRKTMLNWAWGFGVFLLLIFSLGASFWQNFFHTQSSHLFIIFGMGLPFYLAQGVNRGVLQGQARFKALSLSYQAEMWTRLITGVGFAWLGWGTIGAVFGLTLSFVATWLASERAKNGLPSAQSIPFRDQKSIFSYSGGVSLTYLSQIIITNSDIIIAKHFFPAEVAGQYAALALIGRVIYFATWAITTTLFPIIAQRHQSGKSHIQLLRFGLALVFSLSIGTLFLTWAIPEEIVNALFGSAYVAIAPLLWRYVIAAALYSLANVFISYQLALGIKIGGIIALFAGLVQIAVLWNWHTSLEEIVDAQIIIMASLLSLLFIKSMEKKLKTYLKVLKSILYRNSLLNLHEN
ncbi:MAG: oligosaccharide flippase family protein [Chloroflexi bacterium]|nr:oligosaccharide flippase family protein [Chloroflexota bacterium]